MRQDTIVVAPGEVPTTDVLIYEYGIRIDKDCLVPIQNQIVLARRLYNDVVASVRMIIEEMNAFVMSHAGAEAVDLQSRIDAWSALFMEAKARDDEPEMKRIAQERRLLWRQLGDLLKEIRKTFKSEIQTQYLARIGRNLACDTYRVRNAAVAGGLGWATANAILDAALLAFKKSFQLGRPPRFAIGDQKDQDTLTLQFTAAGGVTIDVLLSGKHGELSVLPTNGCGRRKYGDFKFRLGSAKEGLYATGTWQYHRPLPAGASVGLARLVRRRIGKDYRWALQLMVKPSEPITESVGERKPLVAVHMGWAADLSGRRIAGITDCADPGGAQIVQLPTQIESELERAAVIQGERDVARDAILPQVKSMQLPERAPESVVELLNSLRPLRSQYVSANRLHYLCRLLREHNLLPEWLDDWRKVDRLRWQSHTHIARRARNVRRDFYRNLAIHLGRQYDAIVIEPLDLMEAAKKVNDVTGEKTEFSRKARSGRVVAALYELESAIRWAAAKTETAVLDLSGKTTSTCGICGGITKVDEQDVQLLHCDQCGAVLDRKQNGAAVSFQAALAVSEDVVSRFWMEGRERAAKKRENKSLRLTKMAQGRRDARTRSNEKFGG